MANAYINLYKDNPTSGGTDGTLVSLGDDLSSLISSTVNATEDETKKIKIALRCENGYRTTGPVTVWVDGDNADKWKIGPSEEETDYELYEITDEINNTNTVLYLQVTAQNGEVPALDKSTKIKVRATIADTAGVKELESVLFRNVTGPDSEVDPEVTKEYTSFMAKAALNKVQFDILNQNLNDNPYMDSFIDDLDNAALRTRNQTIIKAINEIFTDQRTSFNTAYNALIKFNAVVGDLTTNPELREKFKQIGARTVYGALVNLKETIDLLDGFVKGSEEDMQKWNQLGYNSITAGLVDVATPVSRISDLIANLTDEQLADIFSAESSDVHEAIRLLQEKTEELAQSITDLDTQIHDEIGKWGTLTQEEVESMLTALGVPVTEESDGVQVLSSLVIKFTELNERVEDLELHLDERIDELVDPKIDELSRQIASQFTDFTEEVHDQIEYILSAIDGAETGQEVYEALRAYMDTELAKRDADITDLNNRVSSVEIIIDSIETVVNEASQKVDEFGEEIEAFRILLDAIANKQRSDEEEFNRRITNIEEILDNIPGDTDAKLQELEQRVSENETAVSNVSNDLDTYKESNDTRVTNLETNLEETAQRLDQDLDRLADRVDDAEARLDVAEQDITAINEDLDDHENRIDALETGQQIAEEVNVRLTTLEEVADITLTQDQIATEREIRNLFENDREGD